MLIYILYYIYMICSYMLSENMSCPVKPGLQLSWYLEASHTIVGYTISPGIVC